MARAILCPNFPNRKAESSGPPASPVKRFHRNEAAAAGRGPTVPLGEIHIQRSVAVVREVDEHVLHARDQADVPLGHGRIHAARGRASGREGGASPAGGLSHACVQCRSGEARARKNAKKDLEHNSDANILFYSHPEFRNEKQTV